MLIVTIRYGQLCNRFFQFAHYIAFCKQRNLRIVNLAFSEYTQYFTSTEDRLFVSFPPCACKLRNSLIRTNVQRIFHILGFFISHLMPRFPGTVSINFDEENPNATENLELVLGYRLIFANGWYFRDRDDFSMYADDIRSYFQPKEYYVRVAKEIHGQIRQRADVVVGLHIRRRDYSQFESGKYYFDDEVCVKIIQEIIGQFPDKHVTIIIASDEPINLENYTSVASSIVCDRREPMIDLMALALCDYIVGPPSTFSMWASFYGKVPLFMVADPKQPIDLGNASVISS